MEKGYFPTSLIKFQVENKTDISYLTSKNIRIGDREYALRRFIEKPRQNNRRYRYTNFTEKPRQQYRYVKPHPATRFRKESITAEKTHIEPRKTNIEEITNHQKTLAEYTRRLELIQEELSKLKNTLHARFGGRKKKRFRLKDHELAKKTETDLISQIRVFSEKTRIKQINAIANKLTRKLHNRIDVQTVGNCQSTT